METTFGIDLVSRPKRTALCAVFWDGGRAAVLALAHGSWDGTPLHDKSLSTAMRGLRGIDWTFGCSRSRGRAWSRS
jgi:hypothetical protein